MRHAMMVGLLLAGQAGAPAPAVPIDPVQGIIDAFRSHAVVALGEGAHGNDQSHAFRLALLRDPRFAATVNDIVLEGANAAYQDIIDRFVRGEDVSEDTVREAWENSTQVQLLLVPGHYIEFVRAVRTLNQQSQTGKVRVLLGDPPMDWARIKTREDFMAVLAQRDSFPAELIRREVLARGRRALMVFGDMHFQRKQYFTNYEMTNPAAQTVVSLLEGGAAPVSVFSISTSTAADLPAMQSDVSSWTLPAFATLRGTTLGAVDVANYYGPSPRVTRQLRMEDQFDALMYFGPRSTITFAPPLLARCADREYMDAHLARVPVAGGLPPPEIDRIKRLCGQP